MYSIIYYLSSIYLLSSICGVYYVYLQLVVVHVVAGGSDQAVTSGLAVSSGGATRHTRHTRAAT